MGLRERIKKTDKDKFIPEILDEVTVQTLFNNCLATAETTREDTLIYSLFTQENGFDSDTKPISYSRSNIAKHKKAIRYLLGQVANTHTRELNIKITDLAKLYTGKQWTDNSGILTEFAILCAISRSIYPFEREGNDACTIIQQIIKPTLSPDDPNFDSWWEEHRAEWEDLLLTGEHIMGFKDRLKKFDKDKFRPQILDESTVQTYFNNCLATAETTFEDTLIYSLFTQKNGFDSDTKPISYSKSNIAKHKKAIRYLLGQVENTHIRLPNIKITDLAKLYTGKQWTDNSGILTEFAILCAISGSIYSFEREGSDACTVIQPIIEPTLSPDDPNFEAWWEEHRAEWED